jgi:LacI family transcriptional regulator
MRQLARQAGVSQSTVSKALRDDPTLPAKRCAEIKKLAAKMGYRPNPLVSALMAQLHRHRRRSDPHRIAWIDLWPATGDPDLMPILKFLLRGARQRAESLGYGIEVYRVEVEQLNADRLRRILMARSQWGLIIPPVPKSASTFQLDLRGLTGVTVGTSLHQPVMHRVSPNHYQGGQLACDRLREKGFRRIGLVMSPAYNERVEERWLAAYLARQQQWPRAERLPPLWVDRDGSPAFDQWRQRHRPDAILIAESYVAAWLPEEKRPAVTWLHGATDHECAWGIDYQWEKLGAAAVELVMGQIHRNERGSPPIPHTLLLDVAWIER